MDLCCLGVILSKVCLKFYKKYGDIFEKYNVGILYKI